MLAKKISTIIVKLWKQPVFLSFHSSVGRYVFFVAERTCSYLPSYMYIAYTSSLHIVDYVDYLSEYCPKHLRKLSGGRVDK